MRKKTISNLFDNFFWYVVYMLPILLLLIYWFKTGSLSLVSCMNSAGLGVVVDNPIYTSLNAIFGSAGTFPLFASADLIAFGSYFVCAFLLHLFVDFLLFIPRLCHKWLKCFTGGDD